MSGSSGGAIFNSGSLRVIDTNLVNNLAGVEGVAVISIGPMENLSNVTFLENMYYCSIGDYGYVDHQASKTMCGRAVDLKITSCVATVPMHR